MAISLLLADDHPLLRQGLMSLLEKEGFNVLAECSDGVEASRSTANLQPDVVVLDFSMPRLNGLEAAREILRISPRTKIIIFSSHREEQYVVEAMNAGVKGYVLKVEASTVLPEAIRAVYRGDTYFSPGISRPTLDRCFKSRNGAPSEILSPRELQVLQLVAEGNTTRAVAEQLNLTVKTVDSYRTAIMTKLDIHEVTGLVRYAVRRGLIKP